MQVDFIPEKGRSRLESFTKSRSQWCVSRQRAWGVPIPALYRIDDGSHQAVMTSETITHIMNVIQERGTDAWWTDAEDDKGWIPEGLQGRYVRGKDTMDVWFDSGTTWTLLDERSDGRPLADVYLEGTDQHRGWFQSSLLTRVADSTALTGIQRQIGVAVKAPFGTLITHGFTLDQEGKKMSKSLGNVISPEQIMSGSLLAPAEKKVKGLRSSPNLKPKNSGMGPDALRLWVATSDYTTDVTIGTQTLENVNKSLQKYRITFKWLLGALADYEPHRHDDRTTDLSLADRLALYQLTAVSAAAHEAYANYEPFKAMKLLDNYVNADLSAFYFESLKDRLYAGLPADRLAAQTALFHIFNELIAMLAPVTPLMVEEVWQYVPRSFKHDDAIHPLRREWTPFMQQHQRDMGMVLTRQLEEVKTIHLAIKTAAEAARRAGKMGTNLDCDVEIHIPPSSDTAERPQSSVLTPLAEREQELASIFVVSDFAICDMLDDAHEMLDGVPREDEYGNWRFPAKLKLPWWNDEGLITVGRPLGNKCPRCWRHVVEEEKEGLCTRCESALEMER